MSKDRGEKLRMFVMEPERFVGDIPEADPKQLRAQADAAAALVRAPCPFCGDTRPALPEWERDPFEPDRPMWYANCQRCGAQGPVTASAEDAAAKWNARAQAATKARGDAADESLAYDYRSLASHHNQHCTCSEIY